MPRVALEYNTVNVITKRTADLQTEGLRCSLLMQEAQWTKQYDERHFAPVSFWFGCGLQARWQRKAPRPFRG